jgi:hypothetical protein
MKTLPQELYDEIFTLTFTYDHSVELETGIITKDYKPPFQLLVTRQVPRADFVKQYYGRESAWIFEPWGKPLNSTGLDHPFFQEGRTLKIDEQAKPLTRWLQSLPEDALRAIVEQSRSRHDSFCLCHRARFVSKQADPWVYRVYYKLDAHASTAHTLKLFKCLPWYRYRVGE